MIEYSPQVRAALDNKQAVIALESTIISHGMPYPQNLYTAQRLEEIASEAGVVPATICIMNKKLKVGLTADELHQLATAKHVAKVSTRDIGYTLATRGMGATTVSATMRIAHAAGISVFATGGLGGVHRGADKTFDISADRIELSQTPVIVVSAGVKAILDIPKTLEYLETMLVNVYAYQTNIFPAFYSADSPYKCREIKHLTQLVEAYKIARALGIKSGTLLANPIPADASIPFEQMEVSIQESLAELAAKKITGQAVTPFLLAKIVKLTHGKSLVANIKLVENNVRLAARVAKQMLI